MCVCVCCVWCEFRQRMFWIVVGSVAALLFLLFLFYFELLQWKNTENKKVKRRDEETHKKRKNERKKKQQIKEQTNSNIQDSFSFDSETNKFSWFFCNTRECVSLRFVSSSFLVLKLINNTHLTSKWTWSTSFLAWCDQCIINRWELLCDCSFLPIDFVLFKFRLVYFNANLSIIPDRMWAIRFSLSLFFLFLFVSGFYVVVVVVFCCFFFPIQPNFEINP